MSNTTALSRSRGIADVQAVVQKYGRNPNVGIGAFEHIWFQGGVYPWPQTATALRVQAGGNAADDIAGANARQVTIQGLDQDWLEAEETIDLAGAAQSSPTTITFMRVNRVFVAAVGTYGATNAGNIIIETTGAVILANLAAGLGQTQLGHYSVPANRTAYVPRIRIHYAALKEGNVRWMMRDNADIIVAPMGPTRLIQSWDELSGNAGRIFESIPELTPKTDTWFEAIAITTAAAVNVSFDIFLV